MNKEKIPFIKYIDNKYFKYVVALLAFIVITFIVDTNNIRVWWNANRTLKNQAVQIEELQKEIETNESRIRQLTSERDSLEKFAREQYLFHEEGEDVYIVSH